VSERPRDVDRPIGPPADSTPARRPEPVSLRGRFAQLDKLDPMRDAKSLWEGFSGRDDLWTYSSQGPFGDEASFRQWLDQRASLADPYYFTISDTGSGRALGVTTLMEIRPSMRVVEVGHIVYSPALQRTPIATEAQYLLARHVFETLGYRRYEWKCDALNAASRRAAERFGFQPEGIFRQHMILKGRSRDTAWFSMLDSEWPRLRAAFEQWLAPENFDGEGRQRRSLEKIRQSIA
jgi:RimJ/RimL family protein N-acetyltransferase